MLKRFFLGCVALVAAGAPLHATDDFVWPTPNPAFAEGKPYTDFVQPTESGLAESGLFGCVRTSGRQFHEGIDLFPMKRDRRGEPLDVISAILPGVVRYVNETVGDSNYGRYIVIEHTDMQPVMISLYGHLSSIAPGIKPGTRVVAGQPIAIMGHTSSGRGIPKTRAHMHLELGVWLSRNFDRWYSTRKFSTRNQHGVFNGMNIVGLDFLDFAERKRAGEIASLGAYVDRIPTAVTVVVRRGVTPDFVNRYPELVHGPLPAGGVAGWRIDFAWYGLPKAWWPLSASEVAASASGGTRIVFHDRELLEKYPCQGMIRGRGGRVFIGPRLEENLDILFAGL